MRAAAARARAAVCSRSCATACAPPAAHDAHDAHDAHEAHDAPTMRLVPVSVVSDQAPSLVRETTETQVANTQIFADNYYGAIVARMR